MPLEPAYGRRGRAARALLRAVEALALLALLAAGAGLLLLARPSLVFNGWTAALLLRLAPYDARWSALSASAEALGGGRHRYALSAQGLCFASPAGALSGCLRDVALSATAAWSWRGPRLESAGLLLRGEHLRLETKGGGSGGPRVPALPAALAGARLERLQVELPLVQWKRPEGSATGRVAARWEPSRRLPWQAAADLRLRDAAGARRLRVDAEAGTPGAGAELRASGSLAGRPFVAGARALPRAGGWELLAQAETGPLRAGAKVAARRASGGWTLRGEATAASEPGALRLSGCRGFAPAGLPGQARLDCRWEARPAALPGGAAPPPVGGGLSARGRLDGTGKGSPYRAGADVTLDARPGVYVFSGRLSAGAEGRLGGRARLSHDAVADLRVPRFSELVGLLQETKWAVPAPFHVLEGTLEASARSRGDPREAAQRAQWTARARLAGARQSFLARASGWAAARGLGGPGAGLEAEADVLLEDVALDLPRLDVGALPRASVDRRISPPEPRAPEAGVPARLRARVRTEKPVRLFSNLAADPVPVSLDLALASPPAAASGTVSIGGFGVRLFRRSARVERLDLGLRPGRPASLDGLVSYRAAEATIRILLLGTTKKPRVDLASDPPMERDEIIALLVYGKSPSELDLDEAQSVGNTRTALESKAFGLASLYLFGTTPIETVTYDAASRAYAVKFRLPGGASMELSSDFSTTRELRVRKLLAPHWAVQSELQTRRDEAGVETGGGAAWLEWFDRY